MADPKSAAKSQYEWGTTVSGPWTPIPHGRVFTPTASREKKTYRTTSTEGELRNLPSTSDTISGTMTVYYDEDTPFDTDTALTITQGTTGFIKLTDPLSREYIYPVYIDSVAQNNNVEGDELWGATISFSENGNLVYPS